MKEKEKLYYYKDNKSGKCFVQDTVISFLDEPRLKDWAKSKNYKPIRLRTPKNYDFKAQKY